MERREFRKQKYLFHDEDRIFYSTLQRGWYGAATSKKYVAGILQVGEESGQNTSVKFSDHFVDLNKILQRVGDGNFHNFLRQLQTPTVVISKVSNKKHRKANQILAVVRNQSSPVSRKKKQD